MTHRNGVEIDYCPDCRGIWLDRGELDKIIERGAQESRDMRSGEVHRPRDYRHEDNRSHPEYKKKKRDSFLEELFDF
jgi:Zn-finger nucleic acid-binding protein